MTARRVGLGLVAIAVGTCGAHALAQDDAGTQGSPTEDESPDSALATSSSEAAPATVSAETPSEPSSTDTVDSVDTGEDIEPVDSAEEQDEHDWLDDLSIRAFVDAYVASHWTLQNGFQGDHSAELPQRVYDIQGGPAVSLMALDVTYAAQPIGATLGLRYGTGEPRWLGQFSGLPQGLQFLHQAFVSWRPVSQFQVDFGEFTTPFGGEVAETWMNMNYTLGSLFQLVQPFYHGGFRGVWTPDDHVTVTAIAVNGYNNLVDNNDGKSAGIQVALSFSPVTISIGYLGGPEQAPVAGTPGVDGRMRHLVDAIVNVQLDQLRIMVNGDFRMEDMGGTWTTLFGPMQVSAPGSPQYQTLWGVSAGANYRVVPELGIGLRGEYVGQPDVSVQNGRDLVTGTFTLDWLPVEHLVIRLDNRIDWLSGPLFANHDGMPGSMQFVASSILGVVVHSD